jgi:A/G-specific adenine glycosylase
VPRPTQTRRFRSLAANLERWFLEEQRDLPWRAAYDPYEVWVAEVMLQQTRMEVVVPYFRRFVARFPDAAALASAPEADVLALWSGLGYYRRARMLHAGAKFLAGRGGAMPRQPEELREIPGVGRYTAGAIASIAFDRPAAVVDGNVARVASRIEGLDDPLGSGALAAAEWEWAERLVGEAASPRALNQGLMELGARICKPRNPLCGRCPVARSCRARAAGDQEAYPRRAPRTKPTPVTIRLFLVRDPEGRILLQRSAGEGQFGGMFHLPHGCAELLGRDDSSRFDAVVKLGAFSHSITHRRITFEVWSGAVRDLVAETSEEAIWIEPSSLSAIPHPSYVRKALAVAAPPTTKLPAVEDLPRGRRPR